MPANSTSFVMTNIPTRHKMAAAYGNLCLRTWVEWRSKLFFLPVHQQPHLTKLVTFLQWYEN